MFGRFVTFNAEFNGIVCSRFDLEKRIEHADPAMASIARQYLDNLLLSPEMETRDHVQQLVIAMLPGGRCTADRVAAHLNIDRRTIHRQLARKGETFSSVLSSVRADLAARHIRDGNRPLAEIAELLGFSALSAFSRWFRMQFGASVTDWRKMYR